MFVIPPDIKKLASKVELLAMDVDGVLTDGRVYYGDDGKNLMSFSIKDGMGLYLCKFAGIKTAFITGRVTKIVEERAQELGIDWIRSGRLNKKKALQELMDIGGFTREKVCYIGDDVIDVGAIELAGFGVAISNSPMVVREVADYVTNNYGGRGAVREVCDIILLSKGIDVLEMLDQIYQQLD